MKNSKISVKFEFWLKTKKEPQTKNWKQKSFEIKIIQFFLVLSYHFRFGSSNLFYGQLSTFYQKHIQILLTNDVCAPNCQTNAKLCVMYEMAQVHYHSKSQMFREYLIVCNRKQN